MPVSTVKGTQHLWTPPLPPHAVGMNVLGEGGENDHILYCRTLTSAAPRPKLWSPFLSTTEPPPPPDN